MKDLKSKFWLLVIHSRPENRTLQGVDEQWPLSISLQETAGFSPRSFIWSLVIVWNLVLGAWNFGLCYAANAAQPDSDIMNFNMGVALYKKEDYDKAQEAFTKALTSDNKKIEADALYNLGNCKYKSGKLKEDADLSATVGLLRESLDYYKRAVELDQKNQDARFNHEFVEKELKVLLDKQEKQQEQQKQGTSSIDKGQRGEEKEQKAGGEEGKGEQQSQKEKEGQGKSQQEEKHQEEQAAKEKFQQEGQGKELSEEGARALLERYGSDEALPDYMDKQTQRSYDSQVLKDW